jgi:hypothetical protein
MAQQCGDSARDNDSAPQKFVQLVGCRDRIARSTPSIRLRPSPAAAVMTIDEPVSPAVEIAGADY